MTTLNSNYFLMIFFGLILSGCAAKTVNLTDTSDISKVATIGSNCKSECKSAISKYLKREIGFAKGYLNPLIILAVNGKFGSNTYYDSKGSYNSSWDASYSIIVSGGKQQILYPTGFGHNKTGEAILDVELKAGQEYYFGQYSKFNEYSYEAVPVIYNNSTGNVITTGAWERGQRQPSTTIPIIIPAS